MGVNANSDSKPITVEIKELKFTYPGIDGHPPPGSKPLIEHFSLNLFSGDRCLLVGSNGAGKTTILKILGGKHMVEPEMVRVLGRSAFHDTTLTSSGDLCYLGVKIIENHLIQFYVYYKMPDVGEDPSTSNNTPAVTRQKLEEVEAELKDLLVRKKQVDKSLKTIENNIWNFEGSYLEETHSGGNLIRGFDSYLRPSTEKKKRTEITPEERLFSRSSVTSEKAVSINDESSSSSDDYIKNGYKQMSSNRKKKRQRHSFTFTQEVKQEVKRIKFTYHREGKDTEEELDI